MYRGFWLDFTSFVLPQVRFAVAGFALDIAIVRWFELHDELKLRWHTTMKVEQSELPCQRQNEKEWKLKSTTEFLWRPNEPSRLVSARPIKTVELKSGTNENTEQLWGDKWSRIDSLLSNYFRNLSVNRWWLDTSQSCRLQPEKVFFSSLFSFIWCFSIGRRAQLCFVELRRREKFHFSPKLLLFNFIFSFRRCMHLPTWWMLLCVLIWTAAAAAVVHTKHLHRSVLESSDEVREWAVCCIIISRRDELMDE